MCNGYDIIMNVCYGTYLIYTYIIACVIYTSIITYILLISYVWTHDLHCCVSYLAIAFIVVFLELLLMAFHVYPQINVQ